MPAGKTTAAPKPLALKNGAVRPRERPGASKPGASISPASVMLKEIRVRGEQLTSDIKDLLHRLG